MKFLPVAYFPAAWFGGEQGGTGEQSVATMAARLGGSGVCTGDLRARAAAGTIAQGTGILQGTAHLRVSLHAELAGQGTLTGQAATDGQQPPQTQPVRSSGGGMASPDRQERRGTVIDLAAILAGHGQLSGSPRPMVTLGAALRGSGELRAMPVVDITRLLQRREEEEMLMLWLLEAVG